MISSYPFTKGLVKVFSEVISKGRVTRLLVTLHTIVQGLKRVWVSRVRSFTQEPQKERTCHSRPFWSIFILVSSITDATTYKVSRGD